MIYEYKQYGNKFYIDSEEKIVVPSETTVINGALAESNFVKIDIRKKGLEQHEADWNVLADDGTAEHQIVKDYLTNKEITGLQFKAILLENNIPNHKIDKITRAFLGIRQFLIDFQVIPQFIEKTYINYNTLSGGTIDFLGTIVENDIEYTALIDWKTGSYTDIPIHYKLQLNAYRRFVVEELGIKVDKMLIVNPKKWTKKPTYTVHKIEEIDFSVLDTLRFFYNELNQEKLKEFDKNIYNLQLCEKLTNETNFEILQTTNFLSILRYKNGSN